MAEISVMVFCVAHGFGEFEGGQLKPRLIVP